MHRRQYLALSAAFLAGCTGGGDGSTDTPTPTEPPTETPTPTDTPTPTESPTPSPTPELSLGDVSLPDGVSSESVSESLVTTHQKLILGEPYTLDMERTVEDEFGTKLTKTTIEIGTNSVHQDQTASGTASKSFWKGGDEGFAQANGGEFYFTVPPQFDRQKVAALEYIRKQIASGDFVPVDAIRQGDSYVIQAEASSATASEGLKEFPGMNLPPVSSIDSYTAMLTITANGLISNLSLDWTYTDDRGESISEQLEYSVSAVGETEVTEPDWLSTARDEAVSFEAQRSDDDKFIVIELTGDGSIPDNWAIHLFTDSGGGVESKTVPAEGGDTVYTGLTEDDEVVVGVNERPSGVKTLSGSSVFLLLDINGVEVIDRSV